MSCSCLKTVQFLVRIKNNTSKMQVTTMTDQWVTIFFHIFTVTILGNLSLWTSATFPSLFYIFCLELTLPTLSFKNENINTPTSVMLIYSSPQDKYLPFICLPPSGTNFTYVDIHIKESLQFTSPFCRTFFRTSRVSAWSPTIIYKVAM